MPMILFSRNSVEKSSHLCARWLSTKRRTRFVKYNMPSTANSASERLNTPRAFVSGTGLSRKFGDRTFSTPADKECTHFVFAACGHTLVKATVLPVRLV